MNKFEFYEIVKVVSNDKDLAEVNNKSGIVVGMALGEDHIWYYAVDFDNELDGWTVAEADLKSTGTFTTRDKIYDGSHITVNQNGEITGGDIKED